MSETLIVSERQRATAEGNYWPTSTEVEFDAYGRRTSSRAYAYEQFRDYVYRNRPRDEYGNPIAKGGVSIESVDGGNGYAWVGRVRYERRDPNDAARDASDESALNAGVGVAMGAFPTSFSTTGGTARIRRSFATTRYAIGGAAPDFDGMIGWNGDDFEGVDVVVPTFSFELESRSPRDAVGNFGSFAAKIAPLIGTTNAATFQGFAPGCVLFTGVSSGSLQTEASTTDDPADAFQYWRLTHTFAASPDTTLDVGGVSVFKPGWAAYWQLTEKSYDAELGVVRAQIRAVYVETTYRSCDFSLLGLGA